MRPIYIGLSWIVVMTLNSMRQPTYMPLPYFSSIRFEVHINHDSEHTPRPLLKIMSVLEYFYVVLMSKGLRDRPSDYHHVHIWCRSTDGTTDLEQRNRSDIEPFEIEDSI